MEGEKKREIQEIGWWRERESERDKKYKDGEKEIRNRKIDGERERERDKK